MANNWKYATLSDRERMKRIRNGDTDVYNAEKKMNEKLKKSQRELGLSTTNVDNWDKAVDDAYYKAMTKKDTDVKVKYMSPSLNAVNSAYSSAMKILNKERAEALENADMQAESARENLSEWLVNNGFSDEGSTAKKEREELEQNIADLIQKIKAQYKAKAEQTRHDYFSPFLR